MKLVFADESAADASNATPTTERLVNFYAAPAPEGARSRYILRSVPGMADHATVPGPFLRRLVAVEGRLYALSAGKLWEVGQGGTVSQLAAIADDANATMAGHRSAITIVSDGVYLVYEAGTVTQPTGGRITPGSVTFLDQYTILGELDGREVEWSEVGDPLDLNALNFSTSEADDDKVVRVIRFGAYLAVMKQESTEIWANTGAGGVNAFARVPGSVWGLGLRALNLVTTIGPSEAGMGLFFIGQDNAAYLARDGAPQPVSSAAVNEALKNNEPTHCFYYEDRGHQFCVIRFADRPAWVYDATPGWGGRWHERATGSDHSPWDVVASAYAYGKWFLGSRLGRVHTPQTLPMDSGAVMRRTAVSRPVYSDGERFTVAQLEFLGRFGRASVQEVAPNWITNQYGFPILDANGDPITREEQGEVSYVDRPVKMWIRVSKDGDTFGLPKIRDIGKVGGYHATCRFKAMGQFRYLVVEMNITDPTDIPFLSEANITPG